MLRSLLGATPVIGIERLPVASLLSHLIAAAREQSNRARLLVGENLSELEMEWRCHLGGVNPNSRFEENPSGEG
ncbi:MAG: hypothetical protein L0Z50_24915 [Verrucomicrobiales bacterium]|nr:hypothetical protein [Verrucomicrobiales bacterium]